MDFLHRELDLTAGDVVEVTLDHAANVQFLDPNNFAAYQQRRPYQYLYGGHVSRSPFRFTAPSTGKWHLVVDLGGGAGAVRASVAVLPAMAVS